MLESWYQATLVSSKTLKPSDEDILESADDESMNSALAAALQRARLLLVMSPNKDLTAQLSVSYCKPERDLDFVVREHGDTAAPPNSSTDFKESDCQVSPIFRTSVASALPEYLSGPDMDSDFKTERQMSPPPPSFLFDLSPSDVVDSIITQITSFGLAQDLSASALLTSL